jgi:hypothetical protein
MRYEHIVLDMSTAACHALKVMLDEKLEHRHSSMLNEVGHELLNLQNELRARLQRRDQDPHWTKHTLSSGPGNVQNLPRDNLDLTS